MERLPARIRPFAREATVSVHLLPPIRNTTNRAGHEMFSERRERQPNPEKLPAHKYEIDDPPFEPANVRFGTGNPADPETGIIPKTRERAISDWTTFGQLWTEFHANDTMRSAYLTSPPAWKTLFLRESSTLAGITQRPKPNIVL